MLKKTAAAVLGIIAAGGIVAVVDALGHAVYPIPPDIDFEDPVQFGIYVQSLPIAAAHSPGGSHVVCRIRI